MESFWKINILFNFGNKFSFCISFNYLYGPASSSRNCYCEFFFNSTLTISKSFFLNRCPDHQAIHTALRLIIVRTFQGKKSVTVVKQI